MAYSCKLCKQFGEPHLKMEESIKKELYEEENTEAVRAHLRTHRLQSRLIISPALSVDKVLKTSSSSSGKTKDKGAKKSNGAASSESLEKSKVAVYCKRLLMKRSSGNMNCAKCGCKFTKGRVLFRRVRTALNHACVHLGKLLFSCLHCDKRYACANSIKNHLAVVHKLSFTSANYSDSSLDHQEAITDMLKCCFGTQTTLAAKASLERQLLDRDKSLQDCAGLLLRNRSIDEPVTCSECNRKLHLFAKSDGSWRIANAISHACIHLGKLMFACKHCDSQYACRRSMKKHLGKIHSLNGDLDNYVDSSDSYCEEIIEWINRCFGKSKEKAALETPTQCKRHQVRNLNALSNFCRKIILNRELEGKLPCSKCGKIFKTHCNGNIKTRKVFDHAYKHLGKPLFACRQCDYWSNTKAAVEHHLRYFHKLSGNAKNYVDSSGEYRKEFTDMFATCFDHP